MKKSIVIGFVSVILLVGVFLYQVTSLNDGRFSIVVCDVGQGDAIFMRSPKGRDILIDAGPSSLVLDCLTSHMPFWDKTIELAILTHPHRDHLNGFLTVLKNYKVLSFVTLDLKNNTSSFKAVLETLKEQNINIRYVYLGDKFTFNDGVSIVIVGPSREFLKRTSNHGVIGESKEFANVESLVRYKNFSALLTGDSQSAELKEALDKYQFKNLSLLQVPHHGSKTGLDEEFINTTSPQLAVISVGEKNKYGHPARETVGILRDKGIKILRTDRDGEIEIVSNGNTWFARQKKIGGGTN